MKKVLILIVSLFALNSCNTLIGLGRDMRQAGEGLEKTAKKSKGENAEGDAAAPTY